MSNLMNVNGLNAVNGLNPPNGVNTVNPNGVQIPLLAPNILDQNQIAMQLQNVVNQNIISTNTMNFVTNNNNETLTPQMQRPHLMHQLSATPTLLNVANGVIPGVEAGLYWYHPQIDKSAGLMPVVINDLTTQQSAINMQQQVAFASYQNAMQQIAIQQQLQQK